MGTLPIPQFCPHRPGTVRFLLKWRSLIGREVYDGRLSGRIFIQCVHTAGNRTIDPLSSREFSAILKRSPG